MEEEVADIQAALAIETKIASGDEELIPADVVDRLLAGEAPLRVWRKFRQLTQVALAGASGVNRVQIVEIEAGRSTGSVRTLSKLAAALAVDNLAHPVGRHVDLAREFRWCDTEFRQFVL